MRENGKNQGLSDWRNNPQAARALTVQHGSRRFYHGVRSYFQYCDEWYTPAYIPAALGAFDIDPCAGPNHFASRNVSKDEDGLSIPWHGRVWLNPPYSTIEEWLDRFVDHGNGVALVNNRTETRWFQSLCARADGLLLLAKRIKFANPEGRGRKSTTGSVLVAIGQGNATALQESGLPGVLAIIPHSPTSPAAVAAGEQAGGSGGRVPPAAGGIL